MPTSKIKRIKKAQITRVALVPRGANRIPALYKEDGSVEIPTLSKFEAEKGELLSLVYVPDQIDGQGHFADRSVVTEMAHSHMRGGAALDLRHDDKALTKEQAYVAESFIVQQGDSRFAGWKDADGSAIDASGGWAMLIKIDDPEIRKKYGQEGWEGVSLFAPAGKAELETVSDQIVERFRKGNDMNKEEVLALFKEQVPTIVAGVVEALKPEVKKEAPKVETPKVEEGVPLLKAEHRADPEKIKEHLQAVRVYNLQKSVDWNDPKSIENYQTSLAALTKTEKPKEETDEVKTLRKQLEKALGASSQPDSADQNSALSKERLLLERTGLTKEQLDQARAAEKAADAFNAQRGFGPKK